MERTFTKTEVITDVWHSLFRRKKFLIASPVPNLRKKRSDQHFKMRRLIYYYFSLNIHYSISEM